MEVERERLTARLQSEMKMIVASIVLKHDEALSITLKKLVADLGLSHLEICLPEQVSRRIPGVQDQASADQRRVLIDVPIRDGDNIFGSVRVAKSVSIFAGATGNLVYWVLGLLFVQLLVFLIVRRFLRLELIDPIKNVISTFDRPKSPRVKPQLASSFEIEELTRLFDELQRRNAQFHAQLVESEKKAVLGKVASQVSHDIRSPLAALEELLPALRKLPELERVLARRAINRIRDIAHGLLARSRKADGCSNQGSETLKNLILVPLLVETIAAEKRAQYRAKINIEITSNINPSAYDAFSEIGAVDFQRVLSNLVDNSIDAFTEGGHVSINVSRTPTDLIQVVVTDDGSGISEETLRLLREGVKVTEGKEQGNGLGLSFAREKTREWGAALSFESAKGKGTSVYLTLGAAASPPWFLNSLDLSRARRVAIVDDDPSIHEVWKAKLADTSIQLFHFSDFKSLVGSRHGQSLPAFDLYLVDYEFIDCEESGIALALLNNMGDRTVIVTSHFETADVQEACVRHGMKLLPKALVAYIPLVTVTFPNSSDVVLIDDDEVIHLSWHLWTKRTGKRFAGFYSPQAFLEACTSFPKSTPIFIDVHLKGPVRGDDFARTLFAQGYRELFLLTGEAKDEFENLTWLRGVRGKSPPSGTSLA